MIAVPWEPSFAMRCSCSSIRRGSKRAICGSRMGGSWRSAQSVAAEPKDEIVDCGGAVLMPGLVNGHTHLYSALAAGMPAPPRPPTNFHEILKFIWWRLDRAHTLESVRTSGVDRGARRGPLRHDDAHRSSCFAQRDRRQPLGARRRHRGGRLPGGDVLRSHVPQSARRKRAKGSPRTSATSGCASSGPTASSRRWSVRTPASRSTRNRSSACVDLAQRLGVGVHIHAAEDPIDERNTLSWHGCRLLRPLRAPRPAWTCPARSSPTARTSPTPTWPASTRTRRRSRWPTTHGRT